MTRPLSIGVVIPKYGLVGGGETFVLEITERLANDPALDVHVFANRWRAKNPRVTFHKVRILRFPRFLSVISFAWFARRQINRVGVDVIHTHERIFEADVYTLHGIPHRVWIDTVRKKRPSLFDRATSHIERRLVEGRRCRYFLPVSTLTREAFVAAFDCREKTVRVVHPGIAVETFAVSDRESCRSLIRRQFGFKETDRIVLFVGMNFEIKGLDHLMAAVAAAKRQPAGKTLKLLVVGKGNAGKYGRLAETLGIGADVVFAGVYEQGLETVYGGCDCFAMLSRFDTFGLVVLEAMAASLPVVISRQVGARDVVSEGQNGYVVERTDPAAVADRLLRVLEGDATRRMGRAARETAARFDWAQTVAQVKEIYRLVHSQEARGRPDRRPPDGTN